MGRQIIKQPNGLYCVFSSVVDSVIMHDATPEDIIEEWARESREEIEHKVNQLVAGLNNDELPKHPLAMNYNEMLEHISIYNSKKEAKRVKSIIEQPTSF